MFRRDESLWADPDPIETFIVEYRPLAIYSFIEMDQRHHHRHEYTDYNRIFAIGVFLNGIFVVVEAGYGALVGSLALIADAGHNFIDILSLLLAWGASLLATRSTTERHTYGYGKTTVLASLLSAILLLAVTGGISWEAIVRLIHPHPLYGKTIIIVAAIGVFINTATALLFLKGQRHDLNIRGAFLHMAADAAVSLGVVVAGLAIWAWGWNWIDPAVSLVIAGVIFISTWDLFKESLNYIIDAVPARIDIAGIREYLSGLEGVRQIHDLHIWPLSTTQVALTVHLVVDNERIDNDFLCNIQRELHRRFGIEHATIQVETSLCENRCILKDGRDQSKTQ